MIKYIFDFDDTIWARDQDALAQQVSKSNIRLINDKLGKNAIIISGNTYQSIRLKLVDTFKSLDEIQFDIWADANTTLYRKDIKIDFIDELQIDDSANKLIDYLGDQYNLQVQKFGYPQCVNLKIKPLTNLERQLLVNNLNNYEFSYLHINDCIAKSTGKTTVDILHKYNDKIKVFNYIGLNKYNTIYVGDEIDFGNDCNIAKACTNSICVNNIFDTKGVLQLI